MARSADSPSERSYVYERIEFLDAGPDRLGRRHFALFWTDAGGVFRPEPSKEDGEPVGYRRAQHFFAKPPTNPPTRSSI